MRIVFWQNLLSFYQAAHITALAAYPNVEITWVVEKTLTPDRAAQGWKVPETSGVEVIVAPNEGMIHHLVNERVEESVHIFTGIHQDPIARKAFYFCIKTSARMGLLVEPPFPGHLRNLISPPLHWVHRLIYGKRISFILAMGHMAVTFYKSIGYRKSLVFPYGYFPAPSSIPAAEMPKEEAVQILYLGQLIERKGVDILLKALGYVADLNWRLTIVGDGNQKSTLMALGKKLGLENRITFRASLENQIAMQVMKQTDLFVLPSRHDGWGVVVNEALMCGVPVICSDHCGAAELLREAWRGEVFQANSVESLKKSLQHWISKGKRTDEEKKKIKQWSRCIEGDKAAEYLLKVICSTINQDPAPLPPWREHLQNTISDPETFHQVKSGLHP